MLGQLEHQEPHLALLVEQLLVQLECQVVRLQRVHLQQVLLPQLAQVHRRVQQQPGLLLYRQVPLGLQEAYWHLQLPLEAFLPQQPRPAVRLPQQPRQAVCLHQLQQHLLEVYLVRQLPRQEDFLEQQPRPLPLRVLQTQLPRPALRLQPRLSEWDLPQRPLRLRQRPPHLPQPQCRLQRQQRQLQRRL